jgi:hypothetical protein
MGPVTPPRAQFYMHISGRRPASGLPGVVQGLSQVSRRVDLRPKERRAARATKRTPTPATPRKARASSFRRTIPGRAKLSGCAGDQLSDRRAARLQERKGERNRPYRAPDGSSRRAFHAT